MRIAITADLHWGHNRLGDEATRLLYQHLEADPPDLLLLGGDIGTSHHFGECLDFLRPLPCRKALVPGNHDLWVTNGEERGDSMALYEHHLPEACRSAGVHYLDRGPLILPEADLAVVGAVNWYDYSWSLERLKRDIPNWQWHLQHKAFTRGRHNDGKFVRWPTDDVGFTRQVVASFERGLDEALSHVSRALVLTHHPAFYGISFPHTAPPATLDELLWDALAGNAALERTLIRHADRIAYIFSGHTHRATEALLGNARGHNIGGDYHFKRMLILNWPEGTVETHIFGDPMKRR